jgi:hypothetical protein
MHLCDGLKMMIEWRKRPDLVTLKRAKMMEAMAGRISEGFVGLLNALGHYSKYYLTYFASNLQSDRAILKFQTSFL